MSIRKNKKLYNSPLVERFLFSHPLHLLVSMSAEAGVEDWEEGEEL